MTEHDYYPPGTILSAPFAPWNDGLPSRPARHIAADDPIADRIRAQAPVSDDQPDAALWRETYLESIVDGCE